MKKTLIIFAAALFAFAPVYSKSVKNESKTENQNTVKSTSNSDSSEEKSDWKEQGKNALTETGKFFKAVGSEIGESVKESYNNATEVKCYGTWVYKSEHCTNTITINEDGTMEVSKKVGFDTDYWKGTYSVKLHSIGFTITESGRKGAFKSNSDVKNAQKWYVTYFTTDDDSTIKFVSDYIPTDSDGTDFSKGVIFTKK